MGRLTEKDRQGNWCLKGVVWEEIMPGAAITQEVYEKLYGALFKLKDYEDTGLNPDEVQQLEKLNTPKRPDFEGDRYDNKAINLSLEEFEIFEKIIRSKIDEVPDNVEEKSILCMIDKDGVLTPYDDTYDVVIHCSNKEDQEQTVKLIKDLNWIPVSERLPETDDYILISFDNASFIDIGRYEKDEDGGGAFYPGDEDESYSSIGIFVNAWKPLPEPYKEGSHD